MNVETFLTGYWRAVEKNDKPAFVAHFHDDAKIYLHDTSDLLTPDTYMSADGGEHDCDWKMTIDRIDKLENSQVVTITFHRSPDWVGFITSFFTFKDDLIAELHEYFSPCDDNIVPQWCEDLAENEIIGEL